MRLIIIITLNLTKALVNLTLIVSVLVIVLSSSEFYGKDNIVSGARALELLRFDPRNLSEAFLDL